MPPAEDRSPFQYALGQGLNVGLVQAGWPPDVGGVESHGQDLARELVRRGHQVYVLCLDTRPGADEYTHVDSQPEPGIFLRRLAYRYGDQRKLFDVHENKAMRDAVLGWMAETPCDVVHVHHLTGFGGGALAAIHDVGQPLVMTLHDYWMLDPRGQLFGLAGERLEAPDPDRWALQIRGTWPHLLPSGGAEATDHEGRDLGDDRGVLEAWLAHAVELLALPKRLLTPSEASKRVFVRAGMPTDRIEVCENGVTAGELAEEVARRRAANPRTVGPVKLGVLGTVLPSKGALELAEAFVEADLPDLELHVHGNEPSYHGDTSYVERLRGLASANDRLTLHGPYARDELAGILAGLDGVAAPSRWEEVFGLTVREARAAGLPVLVSDAGALPDVAASGGGLVVPHDDRAAWIAALRTFATDADARAKWAAAPGEPRSIAQMTDQIEAVYADVIEEVTGRRPGAEPEPAATAPPRKGFLARLFGKG